MRDIPKIENITVAVNLQSSVERLVTKVTSYGVAFTVQNSSEIKLAGGALLPGKTAQAKAGRNSVLCNTCLSVATTSSLQRCLGAASVG
jgi:hypothetical protein